MKLHDDFEMGFAHAKSGYYKEPLYPTKREYMDGWNEFVNVVLPEIDKVKRELCKKS